MKAQFGYEQTFRIVPEEPGRGKKGPLDARNIEREFLGLEASGRPLPKQGKEFRPIIVKFHYDNEPQKFEAVTNVGSAKQVARWVVMFRELATALAPEYPSTKTASFQGSHVLDLTSPFGGPMRKYTNTNGIHVNFSILFNGENGFENRALQMHTIHGVKTLSEETTLMVALYPNDYERYKISGTHKPNYIGVTEGKDDKSLRVVDEGRLRPHKRRVEDRVPSSSANPYYASLRVLVGMYLGLGENVALEQDGEKPKLEVAPAEYGYLEKAAKSEGGLPAYLKSFFVAPKEVPVKEEAPLHVIPKDIGAAIEEFREGKILRESLNELSMKYGEGSPVGDLVHAQVLQRARDNAHEGPTKSM